MTNFKTLNRREGLSRCVQKCQKNEQVRVHIKNNLNTLGMSLQTYGSLSFIFKYCLAEKLHRITRLLPHQGNKK